MILGSLVSSLLVAASLNVDVASHSVTFTAKATGVEENVPLEFFFVGPTSDRDYEALFVTTDDLKELLSACERAGFPMGKPVDSKACSFWPVGVCVTIEPDIWAFVRETRNLPHLPIVWTGGMRGADGQPEAATNMPSAFFSLYTCGQSPLLFDDALDQSVTYGRFLPVRQMEKGKEYTFTLSWDGTKHPATRRVVFAPGTLKETLEGLRTAESGADILPVFDPNLTVREAQGVASALSVLDSRGLKVNGFDDGQFFYRGFLPLEKWRNRAERLSQPLEVRLGETNVYTVVEEDWTVEGIDPKLTPKTVELSELATCFKGDACLFYAPAEMKVQKVFDCMRDLPRTIHTWYVFCEP